MSIARISKSGFMAVAAPASLGPAPSLQWLAIENLVVDDSYQRTIGKAGSAQIRRIAERFDWRKFAPVIVSPIEGGAYAVVDGQHRCTAAALIGIESVPCQVILADRVQQADAFAAVNGEVTKLSTTQLWRARKAAGDPVAIAAGEICDEAGVRVVFQSTKADIMEPGDCSSIVTIERLAGSKPRALIVTTLRCLVAGGRGQGGVLARIAILGCFNVLEAMSDRPEDSVLTLWFRSIHVKKLLVDAERDAKLKPGVTAISLFEADLTDGLDRVWNSQKTKMAVPA